MKRSVYMLVLCGLISLIGPLVKTTSGAANLPAKEEWMSVRSKNFLLIGNASEKDIRKAATRLEQFRDVFTKLFPKVKINSVAPTRVIVFKNRTAFKPFMPAYQDKINEVAGYFQPGQDVNHIVLTAELRRA